MVVSSVDPGFHPALFILHFSRMFARAFLPGQWVMVGIGL
jgi:hypothetical protein